MIPAEILGISALLLFGAKVVLWLLDQPPRWPVLTVIRRGRSVLQG